MEHHHEIPGELELLTVTPEQEAIFQSLSAVGPDRFQEFVADVLVLTQGHTLVDITGGPGDEKQDILTITPDGKRQLTQCKHTINPSSKSSGEELDQMFAATFRKNCQIALYVTNGDLTPQAKRYVNDEEYLRGSRVDRSSFPSIDYWTGRHIWEHIAGHAQLLNKWFSGAGQVHGLRSITVRMVTTQMPERDAKDCDPELVQAAFNGKGGKFTLSTDTWFAGAHEVPGAAGELTWNSPLPALKARITQVPGGRFDVDEAVLSAASGALSSLGHVDGWLHQFVSAPSAVLVMHDLQRPVICEVAESRSLVKVGEEIEDELLWGFDPGEDFTRNPDEDLTWNDNVNGAEWSVAVAQPIGFQEAYGIKLRQQQLVDSAKDYTFWALQNTRRNHELLVSLVSVRGMILQHGDDYLLLALPLPEAEATARRFKAFCERNEVPYKELDDEERVIAISQIEDIPDQRSKIVGSRRELQSPIDLTARYATLQMKISFEPIALSALPDLLTYKWSWEQKRGFDAMMGRDTVQLGSEELFGRLFEFQTIRGSHMLDIGVVKDGALLLCVRRVVETTERANRIAKEMMEEMQQVVTDLREMEPRLSSPSESLEDDR